MLEGATYKICTNINMADERNLTNKKLNLRITIGTRMNFDFVTHMAPDINREQFTIWWRDFDYEFLLILSSSFVSWKMKNILVSFSITQSGSIFILYYLPDIVSTLRYERFYTLK